MAKQPNPPSLSKRIEAALKEGRHAQALEFAKQNALQTPGIESQALLRRCYLTVAEYHVNREAFRDSHAVLTEAEKLPFEAPEWWQRLAELRADLGDHKRALELVAKVADPKAKNAVLGRIVDRAMREPGDSGKTMLPPEYHAPMNLIQQAFAAYEKNQDDQVRELLNGIGLTSPFLEWKVLLRGLLAWSANDDAKAAENWDRLNANRLPAKLVAPLRFSMDRAYAAQLSPERLPVVQRQAESLSTGDLNERLRRLRKQLASEGTLSQALETARSILNDLKKVAPNTVPKLASVFYWAIVNGGQPDDMHRCNKLFGPHPDDPHNFRMQALVMEHIGDPRTAHVWWGKYEEWIRKTPERWAGPQAAYARAMILERMGNLANDWLESEDAPDSFKDLFDVFGGGQPSKTTAKKPLSPSAQECYQQASDLAPTWQVPAMRLLEELMKSQSPTALATAEQLLTRFPKSLPILESAAKLYDTLGNVDRSRECLKQALAINPLDRRLQQRVAIVTTNHARRQAIAGDYAQAKASLAEIKQFGDPGMLPALLALNYALASLTKDMETAQAAHDELFRLPGMRVAGAYRIMVEMSRLKCPKKSYTAFSNAFTEGLKGVNEEELTALLAALDLYRQEPRPYYGMKSHEKKITDCFTRTVRACQNVDEMIRYCFVLHRAKMYRLLQELAIAGERRDHQNAHFIFFRTEASFLRQRNPYISWQMGQHYRNVWKMIHDAHDNRYAQLKELFERRQQESPEIEEAMNPRFPWGF